MPLSISHALNSILFFISLQQHSRDSRARECNIDPFREDLENNSKSSLNNHGFVII